MPKPETPPAPGLALTAGTASPRESVALPAWLDRLSLPRTRLRVGRRTGVLALGVIVLVTVAVVATAAAGPSVLVPRSDHVFPGWEAGPLGLITKRYLTDPITIGRLFSLGLAIMLVAYAVVLAAVRSLSLRMLAIVVVVLHLVLLLSPPLQLTDLFNYLGYARLGGLHHLSPYTHTMLDESWDPVQRFTSWHNLRSPYGELFSGLTYPLALLPLAVAYWILKTVIVLLSLTFVWLIARCARSLGRDPRFAVAFVAFNPVVLIYAIGGFHNDFFMLVPSMAAIALVLAGRDRWAGAMLMLAIAVKFTALLLGPFLLLAVVTRPRQRRLVVGALITLVPLVVGSLILFGTSIPNLQQQSSLLTNFAIPNLIGDVFGVGGDKTLLDLADVIVVAVVAWHFFRRPGHWLAGAGWSTLALVLSLSWAVPWYVIWVLPLAALAPNIKLRAATVVTTVFLMFAFAPVVSQYMSDHHISLLQTPAGRASRLLQNQLAH